jgi:KUP system potassium uptake protein
MSDNNEHSPNSAFSVSGALIALGIVFGDIGTSPLYVIKAIVKDHVISDEIVLGGLSCIFWTLISITTIKYVVLALNADNKGEGGIFALYALVRRYKSKWVIYPALIGCATLLADGFITPPISISSAIEGLKVFNPAIPTIEIVVIILILLFVFQQFGTKIIGGIFSPVMVIWFLMIGTLGAIQLIQNPSVLKAINPYYAYHLIAHTEGGIWFLGAVFLCTTGGEALYSDLGHCGKNNIRVSWTFVKTMLLLNYSGQAAYLLQHKGMVWAGSESPFYAIMPDWFLPVGILVASLATIIASQALITGCFSLINEAMKLRLWPNHRVFYPTTIQGQVYIPAINWFLLAGCLTVVYIFRESERMEAAYGLAITLNMLMTTSLLAYYMYVKRNHLLVIILFVAFFIALEGIFLFSNLMKFTHGGWFTLMISLVLFVLMFIFYEAKKLLPPCDSLLNQQ